MRSRNSLLQKWKSWLRFFQNRSFRVAVEKERSKKYLFENDRKKTWADHYQKARRGAYARTIYHVYEKNKTEIKYGWSLLGILLVLLTFYIVLLSPYFQISPNRVTIERVDEFSDVNIAYKAIDEIYGSSLWFIQKTDIENSIQNLEKNIKKVSVSRLYPNGLKILIESYPPIFQVYFRSIDRNFLLSENGILIPNHGEKSNLLPLKIYSSSLMESPFLDYKEAIPYTRMRRIAYLNDTFGKAFPKMAIVGMSYYRTENEVHIFLENGTRLLFVLDDSIEKQLQTLSISSENTPGLLSSGEYFYIDTRIIGKLFLCKDKTICSRNLEKIYGNTAY